LCPYFFSFPCKVTENESMKITDVGISKPAIDITGILAGTPVYIAPEVFRCEVYDCKAGIYSLGIILWEIWYGEWAYFNVQVKAMTDLLKMGKKVIVHNT